VWKSGLLPAGLVLVVLPMWALVLFWAYPLAWMTTADLTPEERAYYINKGSTNVACPPVCRREG